MIWWTRMVNRRLEIQLKCDSSTLCVKNKLQKLELHKWYNREWMIFLTEPTHLSPEKDQLHLYHRLYYSLGQIVYIFKHSWICTIEPTGFIIAVRDNPLRAAPSSLPPCDGDLATPPPLPPPMPPLSELDHSKDGSKGSASMEMSSLEVSGLTVEAITSYPLQMD